MHKFKGTNLSKIVLECRVHVVGAIFVALLAIYNIQKVCGLPSGVHVDGYEELEEPFYPFQQYIQVRKTYTVEHVPVYNDREESPSNNLHVSASTNRNTGDDNLIQSATHSGDGTGGDSGGSGGGDYYEVPRLREEVRNYKKQEVYEEKGYGDSAYDHQGYGERGHGKYDAPSDDGNEDYHDGAGSTRASSSARSRSRYPSLHTPDASSTKILEYVAATQHDKDAEQKGIYAARENIYCPEVIDFDLSSKSMAMGKGGRGGAKPRLRGLGSKIKCLKEKYFGKEPLPRAIFDSPAESRESAIEIPNFDQFYKNMRQNVDSMSSFQNGRVPRW